MNKLIRLLGNLLGITPPDADSTDLQRPFTALWDVDGIVVVRFHDLNATVSGAEMDKIHCLAGELSSVADRNPLAVILDFEVMDFVSVAAFENVLVRLHKKLNGKLRMCNLPATVTERFHVNQLATRFQIHGGLDEALVAVKIPHLELPKGRRIPLITDRLFLGRISPIQ